MRHRLILKGVREMLDEIKVKPSVTVEKADEKLDSVSEATEERERISCKLDDFEPMICRPEKTAVLFLGKATESIDNILNALDQLQGVLDMDIGVLDFSKNACEELSEKYKIDREATQLIVFENCEKRGAISLDGEDYSDQVVKLKELIQRFEVSHGSVE